jgi:hypothetical protein
MLTANKSRVVGVVLACVSSVSSIFLGVGACSSSNSNPAPVYNLDAGLEGGDAKKGSGPGSDASRDGKADAVTQNDVTTTPDSQLPTDGAPPADALIDVSIVDGHTVDAAVCATDGGCYKCTPTTNAEFLNQCTTSSCSPFNNIQRLPNYDGGLPPLN